METLSRDAARNYSDLSAAFIPGTNSGDKVVVSRNGGNTQSLSIYDAWYSWPFYVWSGTQSGTYWHTLSGFSHDGQYLVSCRQDSKGATLELMGLQQEGNRWSGVSLQGSIDQMVRTQFAPNDDYVVATVQNPRGSYRGTRQTIYAAHIGKDGKLGKAQQLASDALAYTFDSPTIATPAEGSLLAYINTAQQLNAVFYDGTNSKSPMLIAKGVKAVWSLNGKTDLAWKR